jgi:hypothetical protein
MKCTLFINYYLDKSEERQAELDFCLLENLSNELIDEVVCVVAPDGIAELKENLYGYWDKITLVVTRKRPTFNDFFNLTRYFPSAGQLNIIANTDIIIPESTILLAPLYIKDQSTCLALSRWDIKTKKGFEKDATLFDRADSQDTWIFKGHVGNTDGADFSLGIAGCDNKIAHVLHERGYTILNPAKKLKTFHYHNSAVRNYLQDGRPSYVIPPPYRLLPPTE